MTLTRIKFGLFSSFSPSTMLCRRIWMKRRPLQGRGSLKVDTLRPAAQQHRRTQASRLSSPFQPHQGQRRSNFGPLPWVGFSFGYHDVLECDIPLRILKIHGFNFLRKKSGWNLIFPCRGISNYIAGHTTRHKRHIWGVQGSSHLHKMETMEWTLCDRSLYQDAKI